MKNGPPLVLWLLAALLSINIALATVIWQMNTARMDRQDAALAVIEARIISTQAQYAKIDVLDERVRNLKEILDRLVAR